MSDIPKLKGPYETTIKVHLTDGDEQGAVIEMNLSMGDIPTQEQIDECLRIAEENADEQGFRLMNKREFFNRMMRERLGADENFAIPGGKEWDK